MVGVAPFVLTGVFSSTMQLSGRPGLEYSDAGLRDIGKEEVRAEGRDGSERDASIKQRMQSIHKICAMEMFSLRMQKEMFYVFLKPTSVLPRVFIFYLGSTEVRRRGSPRTSRRLTLKKSRFGIPTHLVGLSHCVVRVMWFKYWIRPDAVLLSSQLAAETHTLIQAQQ